MTAADTQATFCATLVDEWIRRGVRHAVVAPGSRSTPMAVALATRDDLAVHVVHDERAAAFVALGLGLDGVPAVLLCTSGTAAANFHPAVVEAGLSDVPMLVVTADRPPELREVGAAQTIDQTGLFGRSVRWFHDPGVPDRAAASSWRSLCPTRARRVGERPGASQPAVPRAAGRDCGGVAGCGARAAPWSAPHCNDGMCGCTPTASLTRSSRSAGDPRRRSQRGSP